MSLVTGWASNIGSTREENQDCCYVRTFENASVSVGVAAMCDGMGGLSGGAYASRTVCDAVESWFSSTFLSSRRVISLTPGQITEALTRVLEESNRELISYGRMHNIQIGTTASVLFIHENKYYIAHVGDSRIYEYSSVCRQITEDDCVAAEKMRRMEISALEYEQSRERHILTQCIGVKEMIDVHVYTGECKSGSVFFLCSDGLYHNMEFDEIKSLLLAQQRESAAHSTMALERTIDRMISRGEKDNLTGVIVYVM
ncbi:MAG: serine/threonine-protein phosphatase [Ruminococcaceae bacterium]|nr:serine/threonine-protein phosphatase [Oscillospiraceae bacterium]